MEKTGHVYILSSNSRVLYIGVTSDLAGRLDEHRNGLTGGFASKYKTHKLVFYEDYPDMRSAMRARSN